MAAPTDKGREKETQQTGSPSSRTSGSAPVPYRRGGVAPYGSWEPFRQMREQFDRLFDRFFHGAVAPWEGGGRDWPWGVDMQENDSSIVVRAEAPGFEPSDFDLQVKGDQLILSASHKSESEEQDRGYREWRQQEFYQSVPLPAAVAPDKVDAKYRNGVLTVTLPKTEESKSRRINVQG